MLQKYSGVVLRDLYIKMTAVLPPVWERQTGFAPSYRTGPPP